MARRWVCRPELFQVLQAEENRRLGGIKPLHPGLRLDFQESGFVSLESIGFRTVHSHLQQVKYPSRFVTDHANIKN
jgi:hypothetical protein